MKAARFWTRSIRAACALLGFFCAVLPAWADEITIEGEVTYREQIALPPQSNLKITLLDVSGADGREVVEADSAIAGPGQVPLEFTLRIRAQSLDPLREYALVAEITAGGALWFKNPVPLTINPFNLPDQLLVIVNFVGIDARPNAGLPQQAELNVTSPLFDTLWIVEETSGFDLSPNPPVNLTISADRRAGGSSGCNDYFAEAVLEGPSLSFGEIATSRKICAESLMRSERAFFAALGRIASYKQNDGHLLLLDSRGALVMRLVKAP